MLSHGHLHLFFTVASISAMESPSFTIGIVDKNDKHVHFENDATLRGLHLQNTDRKFLPRFRFRFAQATGTKKKKNF